MDAKPKLRRFRFSLRTLLVLVTIACGGFGWLGYKSRAKQREREAVRTIQELGGYVLYDYEIANDGTLIIHESPIPPGPVWLRRLLGDDFFANVCEATLRLQEPTDFDLQRLREFPQLKHLDLTIAQATDVGLADLAGLNQLTRLNLDHSLVTDAGMVHLEGLGQLEWLSLYDTQITDAGLVHLHGLTSLKGLWLEETQITEVGVQNLMKALSNLEALKR